MDIPYLAILADCKLIVYNGHFSRHGPVSLKLG